MTGQDVPRLADELSEAAGGQVRVQGGGLWLTPAQAEEILRWLRAPAHDDADRAYWNDDAWGVAP